MGVPEGPLWGKLHKGETVNCRMDVVWARMISSASRARAARWSFSGDTRPTASLMEAARGADLLIHEATFGHEEGERASGDGPLHGARRRRRSPGMQGCGDWC